MPFEEIYAVDFSNHNPGLHPRINKHGWGSILSQPNLSEASWFLDWDGLYCSVTRDSTHTGFVRSNLFVAPPDGIPLESRIRTQVVFEAPRGEGSHPEPWAVALNVSPRPNLATDPMVNVTCQFTHLEAVGGYRLNTPGSLQSDTAYQLEKPLMYDKYSGYRFVLEHYFCGRPGAVTCGHVPAETKNHTTGFGHLFRSAPGMENLEDYRVYSSDVFQMEPSPNPMIGAIGTTLIMAHPGIGSVNVKFLSFRVWLNQILGSEGPIETASSGK